MNIEEFKEFEKELKELLAKHKVAIGVDMQGDTHGIHANPFVVIDWHGQVEHTISEQNFIDASDIS